MGRCDSVVCGRDSSLGDWGLLVTGRDPDTVDTRDPDCDPVLLPLLVTLSRVVPFVLPVLLEASFIDDLVDDLLDGRLLLSLYV